MMMMMMMMWLNLCRRRTCGQVYDIDGARRRSQRLPAVPGARQACTDGAVLADRP